MPRDRRARRSLPSAIERTLSLRELIGDERDVTRHAKRRKSQEAQERAALESLNAYFAMIDQTDLKVEKAPAPAPAPVAPSSSSSDDDDARAASDSELARPVSTASRTQRTVRRRNLQDATLQAEYRVYCEATAGVVKPRTIDEFARTIEPKVKDGMYEGILDEVPA